MMNSSNTISSLLGPSMRAIVKIVKWMIGLVTSVLAVLIYFFGAVSIYGGLPQDPNSQTDLYIFFGLFILFLCSHLFLLYQIKRAQRGFGTVMIVNIGFIFGGFILVEIAGILYRANHVQETGTMIGIM